MNGWFWISLAVLVIGVCSVVFSMHKNSSAETMDQTGPWLFWGCVTISLGCLISGILHYMFRNYTVGTLGVIVVGWFIVPWFLKNYTANVPADEAWGFSTEFFAPTYVPTGGKKWLILKGGRKAWFPWCHKSPVLKLKSYKTEEMDIELEPMGESSTLNAKLSSTWKIVHIQAAMQATEPDKIESFISNRIQAAELSRVQEFTSGKHTAEELRKNGSALMTAMHRSPPDGMGPLAEESRYGVKVEKTTLSRADWPDDVKDANNAIAVAEKLAKAGARLAGLSNDKFDALPEESRKYWIRQAQLAAEVEGVSETTHNIVFQGGTRGGDGSLITPGVLSGEAAGRIIGEVIGTSKSKGGKR